MPGSPLPPITPEQRRLRGQLAIQTRHNPERAAELARDLRAERLASYIRAVVATAPPLTAEQVERLRALLPSTSGSAS